MRCSIMIIVIITMCTNMKQLSIFTKQINFNKIFSKHFHRFTEIPMSQGILPQKEEF